MDQERSFQIRNTHYYLDDDDILHVVTKGDMDAEFAREAKEACYRLAYQVKDKIHYAIDLNNGGKQSTEARQTWKEMGEHERTGKVAIFGLHPVARVMASFVTGLLNKESRKKTRFFSTKEEALKWLKENENS